MTTQETEAVVVLKGMYAAEARYLADGGPGEASFAPLAPFFAPNVVLHQAESLPYGGTWRGHDGMERFFIAMSKAWKAFDIEEQTFLATGNPAVVLTQVHACARATDRELDFPIVQTTEIAGGRISVIRPFYWDTASIASACTDPSSG